MRFVARTCPPKGPQSYEARYGRFIAASYYNTFQKWDWYDEAKCGYHLLKKYIQVDELSREIGKSVLYSSKSMPTNINTWKAIHEIGLCLKKIPHVQPE